MLQTQNRFTVPRLILFLSTFLSIAGLAEETSVEDQVRVAELTSFAEDSVDFLRSLHLERFRAEFLLNEARNAAPSPEREVALQQAQARYRIYDDACRQLDGVLEDAWMKWENDIDDPIRVPAVVALPGVSVTIGGQVLFCVETRVSNQILGEAANYLLAKVENDFSLQIAEHNHREIEPTRDESKLNYANYEFDKALINNHRTRRDRVRYRLAMQESQFADSLPWSHNVIAGLGTGWREPLPLDAEIISETLPLATFLANATGMINLAEIKLHQARETGNSDSIVDATTELESALNNQSVAKEKLQVISSYCGQYSDKSLFPTDNLILDLSATDHLIRCSNNPTRFLGITRDYLRFLRAEVEKNELTIELNTLSKDTYSYQETKAKHQVTEEKAIAAYLAVVQWINVEKARQRQNRMWPDLNYRYGIDSTVFSSLGEWTNGTKQPAIYQFKDCPKFIRLETMQRFRETAFSEMSQAIDRVHIALEKEATAEHHRSAMVSLEE